MDVTDVDVDVPVELDAAEVDAADGLADDALVAVDAELDRVDADVVTVPEVPEGRVEPVRLAPLVWLELAFAVASVPASTALVLVCPPHAYIASAVPAEKAAAARWRGRSFLMIIVISLPRRPRRLRRHRRRPRPPRA